MNHVDTKLTVATAQDFIHEGFVRLTAAQVNIVLRECVYSGQRRVTGHLDALAQIMRAGNWRPKDQLDFADLNGRLILINGYHRAQAQVKTGVTIEWSVVVHECSTEAEVKALYLTFDTNTRVRTARQILSAVDFANENSLSKDLTAGMWKAVPFLNAGFKMTREDLVRSTNHVVEERIRVMTEYAQAAKWFDMAVEPATGTLKRKLLNGGTVAVALVTLRYQPELAIEFWEGVAKDDGLRAGDSRKALINDLLSRQMNSGRGQQSAASAALAWNSYYKGESRKIIKASMVGQVIILGTPFAGKAG